MKPTTDLTGQQFGGLTVLALVVEGKRRRWSCQCQCGGVSEALAGDLLRGVKKSCGCMSNAVTVARNRATARHNDASCPTYITWKQMKQRCLNPKATGYKNYGGRGVAIHEAWVNDYVMFLRDMGYRPSLNHSLERVKLDEGYGPGNCVWATSEQQANNRRTTRLITFRGKTLSIAQWGRYTGIGENAVRIRLNTLGWSIERALTEPRAGGQ